MPVFDNNKCLFLSPTSVGLDIHCLPCFPCNALAFSSFLRPVSVVAWPCVFSTEIDAQDTRVVFRFDPKQNLSNSFASFLTVVRLSWKLFGVGVVVSSYR